jgi:nitroreductase
MPICQELEPELVARRNAVLDEIIATRRSIRAFTQEVPPREMIESVLAAGLAAPFAEAAVGAARDFRRFVVFPKGSEALESVVSLLSEKGKAQLAAMQGRVPKGAPFVKKLEALATGRIPGLGTAPYLIAVAERRGVPSVEQQSIAHCLENMWLKATALDLGFHLVSAMALLADEPRFWALCGLPAGTYDVNGCAVGIPVCVPSGKPRPTVAEAAIWLS